MIAEPSNNRVAYTRVLANINTLCVTSPATRIYDAESAEQKSFLNVVPADNSDYVDRHFGRRLTTPRLGINQRRYLHGRL